MNTPKPLIDLPNEPIWEPQPRDSRRWYSVLERYRLAGCKRSKLGIYRALRAEQRMTIDGERPGVQWSDRRVRSLPNSWSLAFEKYRFDERCAAWDKYQIELRRELWEKRFAIFTENCWRDYERLREQGDLMLENPTQWRMCDIVALYKLATELGATAIGEVNVAKALIERYGGRVVFESEASTIDDGVTEEEFLN